MWAAMLKKEQPFGYDTILGDGNPISAGWELLKWPFTKSAHTAPALIVAWGEQYTALLEKRNAKMVELGQQLTQELKDILGEDGILLYPPYTRAAPKHHRALYLATASVAVGLALN